jgi:hypothetical protein
MESKEEIFPLIWLFRVKRKGSGWSVLDYISESKKYPAITKSNHMTPMKEHDSIPKIKKNFKDTPIFTCVFEYDVVAPSDIYQVVVEFRDHDTLNEYLNKIKGKDVNTIEGTYHVSVPWINTASKDFIKKIQEV